MHILLIVTIRLLFNVSQIMTVILLCFPFIGMLHYNIIEFKLFERVKGHKAIDDLSFIHI